MTEPSETTPTPSPRANGSAGAAPVIDPRIDAPSAATSIAYEKVAQAAALAVQDAADYQRNVMAVSNVAQGKALALMLADPDRMAQYAQILVLAMTTPLAAALAAGEANARAAQILQDFPRG